MGVSTFVNLRFLHLSGEGVVSDNFPELLEFDLSSIMCTLVSKAALSFSS